MERFAKLFETPKTQVLCYVDYDEVADEHMLHQIGSIEGARFDVKIRWDGETQAEKAYAAFEKYDQAQADGVVMNVEKLITG